MTTKRARRSKKIPTIFTIGHSTRPLAEFLALLQDVGVNMLVDVRSIPRSRTNPQFNADTLPGALAEAGIAYRHLTTLGGLRHRTKEVRWTRNLGQVLKLGSPWLEDGPDDGQAEAVFGGIQGEGRS